MNYEEELSIWGWKTQQLEKRVQEIRRLSTVEITVIFTTFDYIKSPHMFLSLCADDVVSQFNRCETL